MHSYALMYVYALLLEGDSSLVTFKTVASKNRNIQYLQKMAYIKVHQR